MLGENVLTLFEETQSAGKHEFLMTTSLLRPGVYTATLTLDTGEQVFTRTLKLIKQQ